MPIKNEIMHKAVTELLEKAQVPARHHLALMEVLKKHIADGNKDRGLWLEVVKKHAKEMADHEKRNKKANEILDAFGEEVERVKKITKGEKGDDGYTPIKNKDYFDGEMPEVDHDAIVKTVLSKIPLPKNKENEPLDMEGIISGVLDAIKDKKTKRLSIDELGGLEPFIMRIRQSVKDSATGFMYGGKRYKFEELMHGGGIKSSGGFTVIAVSGTVNDSNTSFTATTQPTLLNINGAFYQKTGGAITWSYSGGTITISSPVGTGGNIYGIA